MLLVVSDLHIKPGGRIFRSRARPCGDVQYSLSQIKAFAQNHGIKDLLLAGDLFDSKFLESDCLHTFKEFIKDTFDYVYYIQGQHDFSDPPWPSVLDSSLMIHLTENPVVTPSGLKLAGCDYQYNPQDALTHLTDKVDIFVFHQPWLFYDKWNTLFLGYPLPRLIVTGDYHLPFKMENFCDSSCTFLSPGCIAINTLAEGHTKYFYTISPQGEIQSYALKQRPFYQWLIGDDATLDQILTLYPPEKLINPELPGDLQIPILYITAKDAYINRLRKSYEGCYLFFKILTENVQESLEIQEILNTKLSPLEKLLHEYVNTNQSSLLERALRQMRTDYEQSLEKKELGCG